MDEILEKEKDGKVSTDRFKLSGRFGLSAQSLATTDSDAKGAAAKFSTLMNYRFVETLETNVELKLTLLSERAQEGLGDDFLDKGIRFRHGSLDWKPVPELKLSAGAIRQGYVVASDLLIDSDATFPAAFETLRLGNRYVGLEVYAEQAIPTSRSLDSERVEKEKMPSLMVEKAALVVTPNEYLQMKPYIGSFRFKDLPSKVASAGTTRGNTVLPCLESDCRLEYGFEGIFYGAEGLLRFNDNIEFVSFYNEVKNNLAPNSYDTAREVGGLINWRTGNIVWRPELKGYFIESDAAVAAYNSAEMGGTNLQGTRSGLGIAFLKYKFRVDAGYFDSKVINPGLNQKDKKFVYIGLETFNVEF